MSRSQVAPAQPLPGAKSQAWDGIRIPMTPESGAVTRVSVFGCCGNWVFPSIAEGPAPREGLAKISQAELNAFAAEHAKIIAAHNGWKWDAAFDERNDLAQKEIREVCKRWRAKKLKDRNISIRYCETRGTGAKAGQLCARARAPSPCPRGAASRRAHHNLAAESALAAPCSPRRFHRFELDFPVGLRAPVLAARLAGQLAVDARAKAENAGPPSPPKEMMRE